MIPATSEALPPELLNNDPEGYAWGVWQDRTPKLIAQLMDVTPWGPEQRHALESLLDEIASGPMRPLGAAAHDHDVWASWGTGYFGRPWSDASFLWSESYFYRRVLEATGYFAPGPWRGVDPFEPLKSAELADPALEADLRALDDLEELPDGEKGQAKLLAALWGNRADLGFRIGLAPGHAQLETEGLVADQSDQLWRRLGPDAQVAVVADNAGRELVADLVLIDHLLGHGLAASVSLHLKPHPYYVSDATATDYVACLRRLGQTPGAAARISARLREAATAGRVTIGVHDFACAPWSYHRMPGDLAARLRTATLAILKGDLNYRRLVGDRAWPATTDFTAVTAYFPCPVAALRTLKSDVVTGLDAATEAGLDAGGPRWRTDGTHGLISVTSG
ncbi:damage-control phosphatase ARMT1 family protein [Acrocarpospora phusangensis]|nr:damage-control phosphatase ARMT1 family protein [Acrocarpospora phusangensis]